MNPSPFDRDTTHPFGALQLPPVHERGLPGDLVIRWASVGVLAVIVVTASLLVVALRSVWLDTTVPATGRFTAVASLSRACIAGVAHLPSIHIGEAVTHGQRLGRVVGSAQREGGISAASVCEMASGDSAVDIVASVDGVVLASLRDGTALHQANVVVTVAPIDSFFVSVVLPVGYQGRLTPGMPVWMDLSSASSVPERRVAGWVVGAIEIRTDAGDGLANSENSSGAVAARGQRVRVRLDRRIAVDPAIIRAVQEGQTERVTLITGKVRASDAVLDQLRARLPRW